MWYTLQTIAFLGTVTILTLGFIAYGAYGIRTVRKHPARPYCRTCDEFRQHYEQRYAQALERMEQQRRRP